MRLTKWQAPATSTAMGRPTYCNSTTGDTWIEAISNGAFNGWHQIVGSGPQLTRHRGLNQDGG
jgi:hypothetical protein